MKGKHAARAANKRAENIEAQLTAQRVRDVERLTAERDDAQRRAADTEKALRDEVRTLRTQVEEVTSTRVVELTRRVTDLQVDRDATAEKHRLEYIGIFDRIYSHFIDHHSTMSAQEKLEATVYLFSGNDRELALPNERRLATREGDDTADALRRVRVARDSKSVAYDYFSREADQYKTPDWWRSDEA